MPKQLHPLFRYLSALGAVVAAYGLYALLVAPLIEGPSSVVRAGGAPIEPFETTSLAEELKQWFGPDDWERGETAKILETRQGTILFQEYQPHPDGRIEVSPLTVVFRPAGRATRSSQEPPLILQARQGATLKFDQPLNLGGSLGHLEGGRLKGPVVVTRRATAPDENNAFLLETRNVQLSEKHIFTMEEVRFHYGSSVGRGRNLSIDLIPNSPANQLAATESSLGNVAHMQLGQLDELVIERPAASGSHSTLPADDGPIKVLCEGVFAVDFVSREAAFNRQVRVLRLNQAGDQLLCDKLLLYFAREQDVEDSDGDDRRFSLTRMVAKGEPAVLEAPSQHARAEAQWMEYDLGAQRVWLKGSRPVLVRRAGQWMQAVEVRYAVQEDGSLGTTVAVGPGSVLQQPGEGERGFQCQWTDRLTIQPNENKKVISLVQDASVLLDDGSQMTADQLHLWLWELSRPSADGDLHWTWAPAKLLATGNVSLRSAQLDGDTRELQAFWPPAAIGVSRNGDRPATPLVPSVRVLRPASLSTAPQRPAQVPDVNTDWRSGARENAPSKSSAGPEEKLRFAGDQVKLSMSGGEDPAEIRELTAEGNVRVHSQSEAPQQALDIQGRLLRIVAVDQQLYRITVTGSPDRWASASARGLTLLGNVLNLDQQANRMWIDGPGRLIADQPADPASSPGAEQAGALGKWPSHTDVYWQGGMVFDGHQIYFEQQVFTDSRQVDADRATDQIQTRSQALHLTLNQFIDFRQTDASPTQVEITRLILAGRLAAETRVFSLVELDPQWSAPPDRALITNARTDKAGQPIAYQQIVLPDASIDTVSGDLASEGPGTVTSRQTGNGLPRRPGALPVSAGGPGSQTPQRAGDDRTPTLSYVQVDYQRAMSGNVHRQDLQFEGQVQCVYGPIQGWDDQLQYRPSGPLAADVFQLACDQLQMAQWTPRGRPEPVGEIYATGNAHARGQQFEAAAHQIRYDQASEVLVLQAGARSDAQLWHRPAGANHLDHMVATKIHYDMSKGTYTVDGHKHTQMIRDGPLWNNKK